MSLKDPAYRHAQAQISDERLAELVKELEQHLLSVISGGCDVYLPFETDALAALRELQERRGKDEPRCKHEHTRSSQMSEHGAICLQCGATVVPVIHGMRVPGYR